jgi:acyl-CoA thioesterase I
MRFFTCEGGTLVPIRLALRICALACAIIIGAHSGAHAAAINILAIGASNTNGKGVESSQAWPAVLESMLRKKGYDAHVAVNAENGITSQEILGLTDSIPAGTRIVIFDTGIGNDRRHDVSPAVSRENERKIERSIRAHGAIPVKVPYGNPGLNRFSKQADGEHFTPESHRKIAAILTRRVIAIIHK